MFASLRRFTGSSGDGLLGWWSVPNRGASSANSPWGAGCCSVCLRSVALVFWWFAFVSVRVGLHFLRLFQCQAMCPMVLPLGLEPTVTVTTTVTVGP